MASAWPATMPQWPTSTQQSWGSWGQQQQQLQQMQQQVQPQMPQQTESQQQTQAQPAANAAARGGGTRKSRRATLRGGPCVSVSDDRCGAAECYCVFTSESDAADEEQQSPQRQRGTKDATDLTMVQEGGEEDL